MTESTETDVLICGGGLAGLTLALQLRQDLPHLRVMVLERMRRPLPEACHKVGESSVELGSQYLERLGLAEYLEREQLLKFGLRFYPGGGHKPLHMRTEIGPGQEPVVRSYQLDRGKFETDLRVMIEQAGATLVEGATVRHPDLGSDGRPHHVTYDVDGDARTVSTRWVVDATGRTGFLKRRMKLRRGTRHIANAGWFRVEGRVEPADLVTEDATEFHQASFAGDRWRSTNHMMGPGYWVWLIPLAGNRTSVGIVTHDEFHGFERVRKLEHAMEFLREFEPWVAKALEGRTVLDFRCLKNYSHNVARSWHHDRWAIVGEAGAFVDPLYSPGTDFIAYANCFTTELIRLETEGQDITKRAGELNAQYRALVSGSVDLYRELAAVYGHSRAMAAKVYWDNFVYWAYACQYFLQGMYKASGELFGQVNVVGARYVELTNHMQSLFAAWARVVPDAEAPPGFLPLPIFPSLPVDTHLDLQKKMTPPETLAYMQQRLVQAEEMAAELVSRILVEYGPEVGGKILEVAGARRWKLPYDPERATVESLIGLKRRHGSSIVVRDVERNLGRVEPHPQWAEALALLPVRPKLATESVAH